VIAFILLAIATIAPLVVPPADPETAQRALNGEEMTIAILAAMSLPYMGDGLTRMPCKVATTQKHYDWKPAREPSGKTEWVKVERGGILRFCSRIVAPNGQWFYPLACARPGGIYGTCYIFAEDYKEDLREEDALHEECHCNGWDH